MFSRMVLPLLGGTPAVWNTCMLFFQAALLGGYLYAHVGAARWASAGRRRCTWLCSRSPRCCCRSAVAGAAPRGEQDADRLAAGADAC